MKNEMKKITLLSLSAMFLFTAVNAQVSDTVKVKETKETKETITTRDSTHVAPMKKAVPPDTIAKVAPPVEQKEEPRFHNGEFGIRLMPTFSSLAVRTYNGEIIQGDVSVSNGYGLMLANNFTRHVGVQVEVNYLKTSQKYRDNDLDRVVDVSYLNIPLLLSLNTNKSARVNWNFVVGPQFGLNIGAKTSSNGGSSADTVSAVVAVRKGDVGLAYGTGLEFMVNRMRTIRIDAGFRGFYGLVNMNDKNTDNDPNTYNVIVNASRKAYGGYLGLTFLF